MLKYIIAINNRAVISKRSGCSFYVREGKFYAEVVVIDAVESMTSILSVTKVECLRKKDTQAKQI